MERARAGAALLVIYSCDVMGLWHTSLTLLYRAPGEELYGLLTSWHTQICQNHSTHACLVSVMLHAFWVLHNMMWLICVYSNRSQCCHTYEPLNWHTNSARIKCDIVQIHHESILITFSIQNMSKWRLLISQCATTTVTQLSTKLIIVNCHRWRHGSHLRWVNVISSKLGCTRLNSADDRRCLRMRTHSIEIFCSMKWTSPRW